MSETNTSGSRESASSALALQANCAFSTSSSDTSLVEFFNQPGGFFVRLNNLSHSARVINRLRDGLFKDFDIHRRGFFLSSCETRTYSANAVILPFDYWFEFQHVFRYL